MSRSLRLLIALALTAFLPSAVLAQAPGRAAAPAVKAAPAAKATPENAQFEKVYGEWLALLANLQKLNNSYQTAPPADQRNIERQYNEALAKALPLAKQLRAVAEGAIKADPQNVEVGKLLVMMTISSLNEDDYEEADRMARLLISLNVDKPRMLAVAASTASGVNAFDQVEPLLIASAAGNPLDDTAKQLIAEAKEYLPLWQREQQLRAAEAKADDLPRVKFTTSKGDIVLELFENEAPNTVANMINLVEKKYYDGTSFHRVLPNFMAQGGDPTGTGSGGPGYMIKCETGTDKDRMHFRGTLSMAHAGKDTGGSQFFLTFKPTPHLNGVHTVFGRVVEGMDVLAKLQRIDPEQGGVQPDKIVKATVVRKRDHAYEPQKLPGK